VTDRETDAQFLDQRINTTIKYPLSQLPERF